MSDQQILINISEEPLFLNGFCDLKCDYSYYYNHSICYVHPNSGTKHLHFTYESKSNGTKQVLYNGIEYNVSGVFIYSPSLHYFAGNQADAEIQILHQAVLGNGSPLVVCIPITSSAGSVPNNKGTRLVEDMINYAIPVINTTQQIENELNTEISSANRELTYLKTLQDQLQRVENQVDHNLNQPQVLNVTNYTLEYLVPGKTPFFHIQIQMIMLIILFMA